jgi:hypothetical protein
LTWLGFKYNGKKRGVKASFFIWCKKTTTLLFMVATIGVDSQALINIFLYKKGTLQLRLCVPGILPEAVPIFLYYRDTTNSNQGNYALTAILHGIIILAFALAAKAINKDSKLVKDSDRLC